VEEVLENGEKDADEHGDEPAAGHARQRVAGEIPAARLARKQRDGGDREQVGARHEASHPEKDASRAQLAQAEDPGERADQGEENEGKALAHQDARADRVDCREEQRRAGPGHQARHDRARGEGDRVEGVRRPRRALEARGQSLGQREDAPRQE
jgi:hypothetical protein